MPMNGGWVIHRIGDVDFKCCAFGYPYGGAWDLSVVGPTFNFDTVDGVGERSCFQFNVNNGFIGINIDRFFRVFPVGPRDP
jgi:hypothetical protein